MGAAKGYALLVVTSILLAGIFVLTATAEPLPIATTEPVTTPSHLETTRTVYTANVGQLADDSILYYSQSGIAFKESAVSLYAGGSAITYTFPGSNAVEPVGKDRTTWNSNFFYGNDPEGWRTNVANYETIVYEDVWNGIDIVYGQNEQGAKYDLYVSPGADPEDIRIQVHGATGMSVEDDALVTTTSSATVMDSGLDIFYDTNSNDKVTGEFKLIGDDTYGFEVGDYDRTKTLVIDPVLSCTLWGGDIGTNGMGLAIDDDGNVYHSGLTRINMYTSPGAYDETYNGNISDSYLVKFNHNLSEVLFATYIGGNQFEYPRVYIFNGRLFFAGNTNSTDFPTTPGAYDETPNGRNDGFIMELTTTGDALIFSTLIGGHHFDALGNIAMLPNGSIAAGGNTASDTFPTTAGAYQTTWGGGTNDTVFFILSSDGADLLYSTFFGGTDIDIGNTMQLGPDGNLYRIIGTYSDGLPTHASAYQTSRNGDRDAYIQRFNTTSMTFDQHSYLGGSAYDVASGIYILDDGTIYISGQTYSSDFPTTPGSYDTTYANNGDFFIMKMSSDFSTIYNSTFIGGGMKEEHPTVDIDSYGNVIIGGKTWSINYPTTAGAFQTSFNGGPYDAVLTRMDGNLKGLINSTYFGGNDEDIILSTVLNRYDQIYVAGSSGSETGFPTTAGAYQPTSLSPDSGVDAFVMKWHYPQVPDAPNGFIVEPGTGYVDIDWSAPDWDGNASILSYQVERSTNQINWTVIANPGISVFTYNDTTVQNGVQYYYRVRAVNVIGDGIPSTVLPAYPQGPPLAPQNFALEHGDGFVQLDWDAPTSDEGATVTFYVVYRSNSWLSPEVYTTVPSSNLNYNDTNVVNGVQYVYSVAAENSNGIGARTEELASTPEDLPTEPRNFTAVEGDKVVYLSWKEPLDTGGRNITAYRIYRGTSPTGLSLFMILGNVTEYNDTAVDNDITFYYQISAINSVGEGPLSTMANATPNNLYAGPLHLSVNSGDRFVNLSWGNPANPDSLIGYDFDIFKGTEPDSLLPLTKTSSTWYNDTDVDNGITYYYRIEVERSAGVGVDFARKPMGLPSMVENAFTNPYTNHIELKWSLPSDLGGDLNVTYNVYAGFEMDNLTLVSSMQENATFIYSNLTASTTYFFRISAVNSIGEGPLTPLITSTTIPPNHPPVAIISRPLDGQMVVGKDVLLDGSESYDPDNDTLTYSWSSNVSGYLGSGEEFTLEHLDPGEHNITLNVSDGVEYSTITVSVTVLPYEPGLTSNDPDQLMTVVFGLGILLAIVCTVIIVSAVAYQKLRVRPGPIEKESDILEEIRKEYFNDDEEEELSDEQIFQIFERRYADGEISHEAYEMVIEILGIGEKN